MKIRKLIAAISSIALACSAFVGTVSAELSTTEVTLNTKTSKMTNEDFYTWFDTDIPAGKEAYLVEFDLSGIADELSYTQAGAAANRNYTGKAINDFSIALVSDDMKNVDLDYSGLISYNLRSGITPISSAYDGGWDYYYQQKAAYPISANTTVTDGKTEDFLKACFVITAGTQVTFNIDTAAVIIGEMTRSNYDAKQDLNIVNGGVKCSPSASFTIGEKKEDAKLAISAKKETAVGTPTMDGHVWSVKLTKGSADITELNAVFTADGYEPAEKTIKSGLDTLNKLTPDGEGFLNFYIGLKTSKPEVGASFTVKNGVDPEATWPAAN